MTQQLALADLAAGAEPIVSLVYEGKPAVKKNSQEIVVRGPGERPLLVPGADYRRAEREALRQIKAWREWNALPAGEPLGSPKRPVHVRALFYLGARQNPDLDGLLSACADILEGADVLANDYWIVSWDGSRRLRDVDNPRTEVSIWDERS